MVVVLLVVFVVAVVAVVLASYVRDRIKGIENENGEKVTFVGLKPTPSAIRTDVLSQLD